MKSEKTGSFLRISEIQEINQVNAHSFRDEVTAAMPENPTKIDIDLTDTRFIDSAGLGALFAVYKRANERNENVVLRFVNPRPSIQQLFELVQLHQLFEIARTNPRA